MAVNRTTDLRNVLRFFDRPTQPSFAPKGSEKNIYFQIPLSYYSPAYENVVEQMITNIYNLCEGTVIEMDELPYELDLSKAKQLGSRANFTFFNPFHVACASEVINILMKVDAKYLISACSKIQLAGINPYLFEYALSVVLLHREDTQNLRLPSPATYMPEFYVGHDVLIDVIREGSIISNSNDRKYVDITPTASDLEPENRVAYFREDIGVGLHHWHWHLVFPFHIEGEFGMSLVNKDRRGELFYYMHRQLLARYNAERFCNRLSRVVSFNYLRDPIPEAYFPKLGSQYMKHMWASRHVNAVLKDLNRDPHYTTILDMDLWRDRILDAIHFGRIFKGSETIPLDEETGIDILGNVIESSILSPNREFYGNMHNTGHMLIAYCHDPDNRYLGGIGVMGDTRTAMRDPIFYRWHSFLDDIFEQHKRKLHPYTADRLKFDGVEVTELRIITPADSRLGISQLENEFVTFTEVNKLNLTYGIDVSSGGPVFVRFPHLQHKDFTYQIKIKNTGAERMGTVRIFLAPALDETGKPFRLNEQRRFFIELDKFTVMMSAQATTVIERASQDSSVIIPFKQMFANIDEIIAENSYSDVTQIASCGCGWPKHMLIPKGDPNGFPCHLFVMVSNYDDDKVENGARMASCLSCSKAAPSYCGLRGEKYPDKRAMGYPFDRPFFSNLLAIEDFLTPNMMTVNVKITFKTTTVNGDTIRDAPTVASPCKPSKW